MFRHFAIITGLFYWYAASAFGQEVNLPEEYLRLFEKSEKDVRKWGVQSDGFAVSLQLDDTDYTKNDAIVAHIGCARFTDDWGGWGREEKIDTNLCMPKIEIRDSNGIPVELKSSNFQEKGSLLTGCGTVDTGGLDYFTKHVEKGRVIHYDITLNKGACLNRQGVFSAKPGTYTVTAVWSPAKELRVRSVPVSFTINEKQ